MFKSIEWDGKYITVIDQRKLPFEEEYITLKRFEDYLFAIKDMVVRGAPLIGAVAGFAFLCGIKEGRNSVEVEEEIKNTRPTAVNLFHAVERMSNDYKKGKNIEKTAVSIMEEDIELCNRIGEYGAFLFDKPVSILTHCNTGRLATCGIGTALGVIYKLHEKGLIKHVWVDETRPRLQGARLTAWELNKYNIPFTVISDNMAGIVMSENKIDTVIIGADRIALNGDTANKIGSYMLSIVANYHSIPFYVAAPYTTFDNSVKNGKEIPIEKRNSREIRYANNCRIIPDYDVYNPAFDIVPNNLITSFITDKGIIKKPTI